MSEHSKGGHVTGLVKYLVYGFFILFALFLFASGFPWLLELPFRLLCGWALHGWKALPSFLGKWESAVLPVGCLFLAGILIHRFIRRWVDGKRPELEWRAKHTVASLSLVLLVSAAAISTSGIMHQFFWLVGGKVIENRGRNLELTMAMSNGRQLLLGLEEYQLDKGRYPRSWEEFEGYGATVQKLWWLDLRNGTAPEPWILLRPGSDDVALDEAALIVSPIISGQWVVVGFGDLSVRRMPVKMYEDLVEPGGKEGGGDE